MNSIRKHFEDFSSWLGFGKRDEPPEWSVEDEIFSVLAEEIAVEFEKEMLTKLGTADAQKTPPPFKIITTPVVAKTRRLSSKWTFSIPHDRKKDRYVDQKSASILIRLFPPR